MATRSHTPTTSLVIPPMLTAKNITMVTMTLATTLAQFLRTQGTKVAIRPVEEVIVEAVVAVATNLEVIVITTMVVIMAMHKKAVTAEAAIASSIITMSSRLQLREITIMRRRRKIRLLRATTTRTLSLRTSTTLSRIRSTRSSTSSPPPSRPRSLRRSAATSTSKRPRSMST